MTYVDDTTIIEEINEGDNITIDCTTAESAYYTALYLSHEPIPSFFLVPNGKKLIKMGQSFTVTNLTQQDAGDYGCLAMDKNYYFTVISKATYYIRSPRKYCRNSFYHTSCYLTIVVVVVVSLLNLQPVALPI